ncbi:MAG: DMT family transporter [Deinococcales bacterium]|nr:DMT family transporter [Deinococcales bacterium]
MSGGARPGAAPASTAAGYLLVALAAVLWALLGVFSKRLLAAGVSPTEIAFWRAALGGLAFACHAALTGGVRLARRRDAPAFGAFALVGVTLFYSALNLAIDAGGVSLAFILLYTAPAFVAVLAALLLGERLTRVKAGLVLLSVLGVALVARSGGGGVSVTGAAVTWGLVAGLSYSSYYLFGKWVLRRYRPAAIYALVMPIGAVGLLPWVPFDALRLATPGLWLDLVLMALLSTYLAYLVYYLGLKRVEASRAVLVATIEPVVAALLAAGLFGERLGAWGLLGAALVLAAALLSALPERTGRAAVASD